MLKHRVPLRHIEQRVHCRVRAAAINYPQTWLSIALLSYWRWPGWTLGCIRVQKILILNSWQHNSKDLAILHIKITFPCVQPMANVTLLPILLARRLLSPAQSGEDHPWLSVGTETASLQKSCALPLYQMIREPRYSLIVCCSAPHASTGAPRELGCHKGWLSNQPA